ncbi:MAG: fasciclin domain-containing protein [Planctomycetota bacterium]
MHSLLHGGLLMAVATTLNFSTGEGSSATCADRTASASSVETKTIVETAIGAGSFKTLVKALEAANLVDALKGPGPFTVFAPSDEAFAKLPKGTLENLLKPENAETLSTILTYHVVSGDVRAEKVVKLNSATALNGQRIAVNVDKAGVRVAGSGVVKTDIACSNGVIHIVDQVMMPATKNLVTTAVDAGQFKILAKALGAAGLVEALSGKGPFTVFAPTDEAFGKLPKGTLESLLEPANKEKLVEILQLHVVGSRVYADQLSNSVIETLGGGKVKIEVGEDGVMVGEANVKKADLETTNGVIHVIDRVLLPGA